VPQLVTGVWVGAEDRSVHFRSITLGQGAHMALPIWGIYMKKIYDDTTLKFGKGDFDPPSKPLSVEIDCNQYESKQKKRDDYIEGFGF